MGNVANAKPSTAERNDSKRAQKRVTKRQPLKKVEGKQHVKRTKPKHVRKQADASKIKLPSVKLPRKQNPLKRLSKHEYMMHYNRLVYLVTSINLGVLLFGITQGNWWTNTGIALEILSNIVVANISVAILARQQYVINFLFWLATRAPTSWPLSIRWTLGKVYHFGGLHSGCAVAGTAWFAVYVGSLTFQLANDLPGVSLGTVVVTYALSYFGTFGCHGTT